MDSRVFVLSRTRKPLMPCHPARARKLLRNGRAAVFCRMPLTIILLDREDGDTQPLEGKYDPGANTTGIALVALFKRGRRVIWAVNLHHRGLQIEEKMTERRGFRRNRRKRHCRYRPARYNNRSRPKGWLPPSLTSRVENVRTWHRRLMSRAPVSEVHIETVRFDTQKLQNPEIEGTAYQRGELFGYEVREYLLEKWSRECAYCGAEQVPLEIEHIVPKSRGGSDRVSNLTLACRACNQAKGNRDVREFLAHDLERLAKILAQAKAPLKGAAAVNSTRYAIGEAIKVSDLPVSFWSGGRTKRNRLSQGYLKDHWIDAACVGASGESVFIPKGFLPLEIQARGRGHRRVHNNDDAGFPRGAPRKRKRVHGFQTGDLVELVCKRGKSAGRHVGRLTSIRARGWFVLRKDGRNHDRPAREFRLLARADGYEYTTGTTG